MQLRIRLTATTRKAVLERWQQACRMGNLRLIKRIQALLMVEEGWTVAEVSELIGLSGQGIRNYLHAFLRDGIATLVYRRPPGRPARLSQRQRRELAALVEAGPETAGYDWGCWTTGLIQDLIYRRFGVVYSPQYVAELLHNMGFSYQKARFVSDHLDKVADGRDQWLTETWPTIKQLAEQTGGMILFGDEASFAQWGSLSYTWSRRGQQPVVKTSGQRRAYKVFGLIDYLSGAFFYQGHSGKFNADSYQAFLLAVLQQTSQHLVLIQDGARYHTSKAMQAFFAAHADRLTVFQLPAYSPDFNPIEFLWRNLKKQATHLRYFPTFADLVAKVEQKLSQAANLPATILALMGKYCESLGNEADTLLTA
jgi:transposase